MVSNIKVLRETEGYDIFLIFINFSLGDSGSPVIWKRDDLPAPEVIGLVRM